MPLYDTLWTRAHIATMRAGDVPFGSILDGAIASRDGRIAWVGATRDLPGTPADLAERVVDARGRLIAPGFVDPHTHLVFAGDRIADFERRNAGGSYVAAARGGSGIAHTVALTRAASEGDLLAGAERRLRRMVAGGTTTVEIKSGYGLDVETELRMLRVARELGERVGVSVRATYLGAHVVPTEFAERRGTYLDLVCDVMIPRIARDGLADAVDVFCDSIAFAPAETARVFEAAARAGLAVKAHADQLADTGAAEIAARHRALSADHLEHASDAGIAALARAGTVAVVLPGAYYYLNETTKPPIATLRARGVPMALATDCNPGTSPVLAMTTILNMACVLFGFSPEEAIAGATRHAARALGLDDRGELRVGARCDLAIWDASDPAELCYWLGDAPCSSVVVRGETLGRGPRGPASLADARRRTSRDR